MPWMSEEGRLLLPAIERWRIESIDFIESAKYRLGYSMSNGFHTQTHVLTAWMRKQRNAAYEAAPLIRLFFQAKNYSRGQINIIGTPDELDDLYDECEFMVGSMQQELLDQAGDEPPAQSQSPTSNRITRLTAADDGELWQPANDSANRLSLAEQIESLGLDPSNIRPKTVPLLRTKATRKGLRLRAGKIEGAGPEIFVHRDDWREMLPTLKTWLAEKKPEDVSAVDARLVEARNSKTGRKIQYRCDKCGDIVVSSPADGCPECGRHDIIPS